MKYLDDSGLSAYDAKIKEWVNDRVVYFPMTLIENSLNYTVGEDVTDQLSYDTLLDICNRCVYGRSIVIASKYNNSNEFVTSNIICYSANNNTSSTNVTFWLEIFAHINNVLYLITVCFDGSNQNHTVVVGEINVKTV